MTIEEDKYLVEKYPKIFRDRYADMRITAMCWGIECCAGWLHLIDNLCGCIQNYIDSNSNQERIKNKYARFYVKYLRKLSFKLNYKWLRKFARSANDKFEKEIYETIPQVVATQVKEKFGRLCFYYTGGDDIIFGMVWLAEYASDNICEFCGTTEKVGHTKGWIYTICQDCYNKSDEQIKRHKFELND